MAIADRCSEETFILTWEEETECNDGVEVFKYLRRLLERLDNDWSAVLQNIRKARQLWGSLEKMLQKEGGEPAILEKFYCAVIYAVFLFEA